MGQDGMGRRAEKGGGGFVGVLYLMTIHQQFSEKFPPLRPVLKRSFLLVLEKTNNLDLMLDYV